MATADVTDAAIAAGRDPGTLRLKLRAVERRRLFGGLMLAAPLVAYLVAFFLLPIATILMLGVYRPEVAHILPRTAELLAQWDGQELPGEPAFAALTADLHEAFKARTLATAAMELNRVESGYRSILMRTARKLRRADPESFREFLIEIDNRWGSVEHWRVLKQGSEPYTLRYLLAAVDLKQEWDGDITWAPPEKAIYLNYLLRSLWISFNVMLFCLVLGYPMAFLMAEQTGFVARVLLVLVLLPFWTSALVRTAAWILLLQKEGIVNVVLLFLGFTSEPFELIYNRVGVYVTMTQILLPFMVLPIFSVMKNIPEIHMRAAASLGATPLSAFVTIYLPQTIPGVGAGCLLVFILTLGNYIMPLLVGGADDQLLGYLIAQNAIKTGNFGLAAAIALVLLVAILALFPVFRRFGGIESIRLG